MSNSVNDIPTGLRVPAQIPLDAKEYKLSQADLANLGPGNNLAYTYFKGMTAYCALEQTRWEWREKGIGETGLIPGDFTYPAGLVIFGITYSNKTYNFFPLGGATFVATPSQILNQLEMSFDWKRGSRFVSNQIEDLPKGFTNNIYQRTGYVSYYKPTKQGNSVVHLPGTKLFQTIVSNLGINVKGFSTIKDYSPTVVISKYTPTTKKEANGPELIPGSINEYFPEITYRKGSYKFSEDNDPVRLTRVPIQAKYQVIDFGQEHYFKTSLSVNFTPSFTSGRIFGTRGAAYRYSNIITNYSENEAGFSGSSVFHNKTSVYLQFHIEITVNGVKYLSKPLGRLKMSLSIYLTPFEVYNYGPGDTVPYNFAELSGRETRISFKHI